MSKAKYSFVSETRQFSGYLTKDYYEEERKLSDEWETASKHLETSVRFVIIENL